MSHRLSRNYTNYLKLSLNLLALCWRCAGQFRHCAKQIMLRAGARLRLLDDVELNSDQTPIWDFSILFDEGPTAMSGLLPAFAVAGGAKEHCRNPSKTIEYSQ